MKADAGCDEMRGRKRERGKKEKEVTRLEINNKWPERHHAINSGHAFVPLRPHFLLRLEFSKWSERIASTLRTVTTRFELRNLSREDLWVGKVEMDAWSDRREGMIVGQPVGLTGMQPSHGVSRCAGFIDILLYSAWRLPGAHCRRAFGHTSLAVSI